MTDSNTVVIGGGHNGLVAGALLGLGGRRVVILEARDAIGGLAAEDAFHPGYRSPGLPELAFACGSLSWRPLQGWGLRRSSVAGAALRPA